MSPLLIGQFHSYLAGTGCPEACSNCHGADGGRRENKFRYCLAFARLTRSRLLSNQAMPTKRPAASLPATARRMKVQAPSPVKPPHPCEEQEIRLRPRRADKVVYASDCSGLDGGAVALRALGVSYTHLWGSELCPASRQVFQSMHPTCKHIFEDCAARDLRLALEDLQLLKNQGDVRLVYTAGFPCQPFSKAGARGGSSDARATVAYGVLLAVQNCQPDVFVLENVPDLVESHDYREMCLDLLQCMVRLGGGAYYIDFKIMDSYVMWGKSQPVAGGCILSVSRGARCRLNGAGRQLCRPLS